MTVSTNNRTTKLLKSGQEFSGVPDDVSKYSIIQINCYSDVDGTLQIRQGQNTSDFDYIEEFKIVGGYAFIRDIPIVSYFMSVLYKNSDEDQTKFRLLCIYKNNSLLLLNYLDKMQKVQKSLMRETFKSLQMANNILVQKNIISMDNEYKTDETLI